MPLFVGTSGWDYTEWKGGFYPADLPHARFLTYYSDHLDACEINTTFYGLQPEATFARWVASTPPDFRFAVKAHRRLTHTKKVDSAAGDDFLKEFLASIAPLGNRLACVLLQFPAYRERDDEGLDRLLASIPAHLTCAVEFRHESWQADEVESRIAAAGWTVCFSDVSGPPPSALPPGPIAYVRLRANRYTEAERAGWLALFEREAQRRDVYAFAKHRDVPADDPFTGVGLAQWLLSTHRVPIGTAPPSAGGMGAPPPRRLPGG
jgi:uncharacterized protein YecE (DUF72 family)